MSSHIDYGLVLGIVNASERPHEALQAFVEQEREVAEHDAVTTYRTTVQPHVAAQEWHNGAAHVVAGVRAWCAINEIAEPPLDWEGLGEFLTRVLPPDRTV